MTRAHRLASSAFALVTLAYATATSRPPERQSGGRSLRDRFGADAAQSLLHASDPPTGSWTCRYIGSQRP